MDASAKLVIIWFTPHQTITLPKCMFFLKLFFKSSLLLIGKCESQVRLQYNLLKDNECYAIVKKYSELKFAH